MGTRHLIKVVYDKKTKVAQYGQWDGYPEGQGETISTFIRTVLSNRDNLDKFKEKIRQLRFLTPKEIQEESSKMYDEKTFPMQFHRDTGGKILQLIFDNDIKLVKDDGNFFYDTTFCEWAYIIDLDEEVLKIYQPPELIHTYKFTELDDDTMEKFEERMEMLDGL